jgi:hypothetical protein
MAPAMAPRYVPGNAIFGGDKCQHPRNGVKEILPGRHPLLAGRGEGR